MSSLQDRKSKTEAIRVLRYCMDEGFVQYLRHLKSRCEERGIDLQDVMNVLKRGVIFAEPELDVRWNQWRYKVEGRSSEGEELAVIVTFADEITAVVITVMSP